MAFPQGWETANLYLCRFHGHFDWTQHAALDVTHRGRHARCGGLFWLFAVLVRVLTTLHVSVAVSHDFRVPLHYVLLE